MSCQKCKGCGVAIGGVATRCDACKEVEKLRARELRRSRQEAGICKRCSGPLEADGRLTCPKCREMMQARLAKFASDGRCPQCGGEPAPGFKQCQKCLTLRKKSRVKRRVEGKCLHCSAMAPPGRKQCLECNKKSKQSKKDEIQKRKDDGLCWRCGKLPPRDGRLECQGCAQKGCKLSLKYQKLRTEKGLCRYCTTKKEDPKRPDCYRCYYRAAAGRGLKDTSRGEDLRRMWEDQGRRCVYSGVEIGPGTMELDHRVPVTRGGTHALDNLQWLHMDINMMKLNHTEEEFFSWIKLIVKHCAQK